MLAKTRPLTPGGALSQWGRVMTGFDFSDKTVWVTGAGKDRLRDGAGVLSTPGRGDRSIANLCKRIIPLLPKSWMADATGCAGVPACAAKKRRADVCWSTPPVVFCVWERPMRLASTTGSRRLHHVGGAFNLFSQRRWRSFAVSRRGDCS